MEQNDDIMQQQQQQQQQLPRYPFMNNQLIRPGYLNFLNFSEEI